MKKLITLLMISVVTAVCVSARNYPSQRPAESDRLFKSAAVEAKIADGIGGPHIGYDMAWPMSIMMKAFTSENDEEIKWCVETLMKTDAGTGFMHESFHVDDPDNFTREWFAWQNGLFGELILKIIADGKIDLLNSIKIK